MNHSEALVLAEPREPVSMELFTLLRDQASALIKTGFLPAHLKTPEQAVAVVLIGRELGVPMMQALRKIFVIQGTPALAAELMLALAERTNEVEDVRIEDDGTSCTVTIKRRGRKSPVTTSFSTGDAAKMNLAEKDNWKKQPGVMRRWRAIAANLRLSFPDAIGGMYSVEEVAPDVAVDATGTPVVPAAVAPSPAELMPRKIGEAAPAPIPTPPPPPADPDAEFREIMGAMLGEDGPTDPPATAEVMERVPAETGKITAAGAEGLAQPELSHGQVSIPVREPLRFTIGKTPYETAGITRDQMLSSFDLEPKVEKKQKGLTRAIVKSFGVEHRWQLTQEQGEQLLIRLSETLGIDPPWVTGGRRG